MEIIESNNIKVEEVEMPETTSQEQPQEGAPVSPPPGNADKPEKTIQPKPYTKDVIHRPDKVEAKVYKLKSRFVNQRLYITLSYLEDQNGINRPIEIFINSKDLSKLPEYTVLTRLISAIFRTFADPKFILEELQSIYDPNGGYFSKGRYIYSFYSEIAMIIEQFFYDIGFMEKEGKLDNWLDHAKKMNPDKEIEVNNFKICPTCNQKSLQFDNGCLQCINPECGYSKCS